MNYDELARQLEFYRDIGITEIAAPGPGVLPVGSAGPEAITLAPAVERPASPPISAAAPTSVKDAPPDVLMDILKGSAPMRDDAKPAGSLEAVREDLGDCTRCGLSGGRTHLVFGDGSPEARLVFVGEAPGAEEDRQGIPFVGRAGQLLTKIIESIGMDRSDVYICNVLKCRPPANRNPEPIEVETCSPFLRRQIAAIRPEIVCCMGTFAAQTVLGMKTPISRLRGRFHEIDGIRYMATFHPAYLLRNPEKKREVWEDMKKIRAELMGR